VTLISEEWSSVIHVLNSFALMGASKGRASIPLFSKKIKPINRFNELGVK